MKSLLPVPIKPAPTAPLGPSGPAGAWTLDDLPAPPPGRHGWPWDHAPDVLRSTTPGGHAWPRVSIVTPSYNQGQYLEQTIRSVLLQGYPNLDYRIMDGGSTDKLTHEVLEKYRPYLSECLSEPDQGQADAVQKGFARCDGQVFNFMNSDDWFEPGAVAAAAARLADEADLDVVYGTALFTDADGHVLRPYETQPFDLDGLIEHNFIGQPSLFHRRAVYENDGGFETRWNFVLDYALWLRWAANGANFAFEEKITAYYRLHGDSKSCTLLRANQNETLQLLENYREHPRLGPSIRPRLPKRTYEFALWSYAQLDLKQFWKMAWRYCIYYRQRPTLPLLRRAGMSLLGPGVLRRLRSGVYGPTGEATV